MKDKNYHKGVLCQLGFHKFEKTVTYREVDGRKGKLVKMTCGKCGIDKSKGNYFESTPTAYSTSTSSRPLRKGMTVNVPINKIVTKKDGVKPSDNIHGMKDINISSILNGRIGEGWIIENGVRRKMNDEERRKLKIQIDAVVGELNNEMRKMRENIRKRMGGVFVGSVGKQNSLNESPFSVSDLEFGSQSGHCTCRSGKWNTGVSHCKACKRAVKT